jgi:MarR-like DNA-binding transcriptional regulator SgrR of sgrS sRNA
VAGRWVRAGAERGARTAAFLGTLLSILCFPGCRAPHPPVASAPMPPVHEKPAPEPPSKKEMVPEEGGDGTFALEEPFTGLAAARLATSSDRILRGLAFHGLTRMDASGRVDGELAEKWERSQDGTEWVFHLRPETAFTNGRYLEARHVVASWEKLVLPADSSDAWLLEGVKGYDDFRSGKSPHLAGLILEDGLTLRVVLRYPARDLTARLAHPALGISAFGEDEEGIGPYQIWGTPKPQLIVLRSNPEYFRGLPHLDEIAFVRGEAAAREKMVSGALDTSVLLPLQKPPSDPSTRVFTFAAGRTYLLGLNRSAAPFAREETMSRFVASIDRQELAQAVGGELGSVPATLLEGAAPSGKGSAGEAAPRPAPPAGLGHLDLVYPEGDRPAMQLAEKLEAWVQKGGGRLVPHPVRASDLPGALTRREYNLFIVPVRRSTPDPLLGLEEMARWNRSVPATLLTALQNLEGQDDPSRIAAGLAALDRSLREQGYLVPLVQVPRRLLVGKGICGLHPDPLAALDWTRIWRSRRPGGECD